MVAAVAAVNPATMTTAPVASATMATAVTAETTAEAAAVSTATETVTTEATAATEASAAAKSVSHAQKAETTAEAEAAAIIPGTVPAIRVEAARTAVEKGLLDDGRCDVVEASDREGRRAFAGAEPEQRDSGDHCASNVHPGILWVTSSCEGRTP